jgi:hypothetical protein
MVPEPSFTTIVSRDKLSRTARSACPLMTHNGKDDRYHTDGNQVGTRIQATGTLSQVNHQDKWHNRRGKHG